jgi:hypothetical protein
MNPHNSKLVTVFGAISLAASGIAALTQWSALGATGHAVVIGLGIVGGIAAVLGKALGSPD